MVLLSPTMYALQDFISVCAVFAARLGIVYNKSTTERMEVPPAPSNPGGEVRVIQEPLLLAVVKVPDGLNDKS